MTPLWKQPVGGGYAGVTVASGRVYTLDLIDRVAKAKDGEPDGTERVLCFDAATGKPLWSHKYAVRYGNLGGYANGPRTSPTIHDGKVYTLGAAGHLFCFDAKTGEVLWQHDPVARFGARIPEWGFAGSPVIDGDNLLVHLGAKGACRGHISTSRGRRSPLLRLQGEQAATTFSQVVWPPLDRGTTWSKVISSRSPHYWHVNRSRRKTFKRVKAGCLAGLT